MRTNWKTAQPKKEEVQVPLVLQAFSLLAMYALTIWLGTSAFYMGNDAIQGAASGYSAHQSN
jgi:hypothetical protein